MASFRNQAMTEPQALKIQGCNNRYSLINGIYERLPTDHHGKPCYVTRQAQPCYIFHSGKARWVISKRIDDGTRCYAFLKDDCDPPSNDLTQCSGNWMMLGDDNQWAENLSIRASQVAASTDKFVRIRLSLEDEMKKYGLTETNSLKQLWRRLDINGNNVVSLAEVDKLVVEMVASGAWPDWLNNKPALMRAFQKAKCGSDGRRDDYIEKCEFHDLLLNIFWFNKIWQVFDDIDMDDDRSIDVREFSQGLNKLGLKLTPAEANDEFQTIDTNLGGQVLFVEFCAWIRHRVNPDDNPAFDTDIISGEKAGQTLRKKHGSCITHSHFVNKKTLKQFDELEAKIKAIMQDLPQLKKLWDSIDFNGNNIVSLAEIDKFVVESYPILNHKPALMRAYHKTYEDARETDEFVHKHDFKALLGNLFYFNKLFWLFDAVDEDKDRRLTLNEFKWCLAAAGLKQSEARAQQDFAKLDKNRGGKILFDEFCGYFVAKQCPEALTEFCGLGDDRTLVSMPGSPVRARSQDGRSPPMNRSPSAQSMNRVARSPPSAPGYNYR